MVMYTLVILVEVVLVVNLLYKMFNHALVAVAVVTGKTVEMEVPEEEPVDIIVTAVVTETEEMA